MLDLGKIRDEIDVTDDEIVRLFQHRMALTAEVAQYKIETGKAVFDAERERQKLEKADRRGNKCIQYKRHPGAVPADHVDQPEASVSAADRKRRRGDDRLHAG